MMPKQTVWEHINLPLPTLQYGNAEVSGQGKGSTEYAAHSHTPLALEVWEEFDGLVATEGEKTENRRMLDIDFQHALTQVRLKVVKKEEDVTDNLERVLEVFATSEWNLSKGVEFPKAAQHILAQPDVIAQVQDPSVWGVGPRSDYISPDRGQRAAVRRNVAEQAVALYRFPFETKPAWKFGFLEADNSHRTIVQEWEVPSNLTPERMRDGEALPKNWSPQKKKIFHVVRQLYGQMATDSRRYGILHIYERWFFCMRTDEEVLKVSRPFRVDEASPSVLQGIKAMVGFDDYELRKEIVHPSSGMKAPAKKKSKTIADSKQPGNKLPPSYGNASSPPGMGGGTGEGGEAGDTNNLGGMAAQICLWDCDLFDYTEDIQLLTYRKDASVLVKIQRDPRKHHVARHMAREAQVYSALSKNDTVQPFIPRFLGHSTLLGVGLSCIEKELDDFDDIGLQNLSEALKKSAVRCVEALSDAGVLHNDVELRNFVRSKSDPNRAKIIDFGRATFSKDRDLLQQQVADARILLGI